MPISCDLWCTPCRCRRMGTARENHPSIISNLPWFELNNHQERWCKTLTFLTHRTTKVPVLVHSSSVSCWRSMSSQLFLIRNSSSQKKSLTTSGDASSKIVLLRYCGGPFWNEANTQINQFNVISSTLYSSRTHPYLFQLELIIGKIVWHKSATWDDLLNLVLNSLQTIIQF